MYREKREAGKKALVKDLVANKWIKSKRVQDIFLKVDRGEFWGSGQYDGDMQNPRGNKNVSFVDERAYIDEPQPINFNVVISAPKLHAWVLELASDVLQPGCKVLDVGSGTGILCAAFYEMVRNDNEPGVAVVGIEHIHSLAELSV